MTTEEVPSTVPTSRSKLRGAIIAVMVFLLLSVLLGSMVAWMVSTPLLVLVFCLVGAALGLVVGAQQYCLVGQRERCYPNHVPGYYSLSAISAAIQSLRDFRSTDTRQFLLTGVLRRWSHVLAGAIVGTVAMVLIYLPLVSVGTDKYFSTLPALVPPIVMMPVTGTTQLRRYRKAYCMCDLTGRIPHPPATGPVMEPQL